MIKKIYILVADPNFSHDNKNSAVAQYLSILKQNLEDNQFDVLYLNNNKGNANENLVKNSNLFLKKLRRMFLVFFPRIYNSIKLYFYFKKQKRQFSLYNLSVENNSTVIEFLTFGSKVGVELKNNNRIKLVTIYDSPLLEQFKEMHNCGSLYNSRIKNAEKTSLQESNRIICYSNPVEDYIKKEYQLKSVPVVIPCIFWKREIKSILTEEINIGFIGSFLKWHKVDLLVRVFEKLCNKHHSIRLILIGSGEKFDEIQKMALELKVNKKIILTGYIIESDLNTWKSKLTIGVMPGSNWYGSPLKLFEYASCGLPIVAPSTPTVMEYFKHNENALLIDPNNEFDSLYSHLEQLILNPELRSQLGQNAQLMMQNELSEEVIMGKFVSCIDSL